MTRGQTFWPAVKCFPNGFVFLFTRWAPLRLSALQPGLRWSLQPARPPADPLGGEEVPVWLLREDLQPHVPASQTQRLRLLPCLIGIDDTFPELFIFLWAGWSCLLVGRIGVSSLTKPSLDRKPGHVLLLWKDSKVPYIFQDWCICFFWGHVGFQGTFVSVCACVWTRGQLDMQLIPRKLHRCRPVRDSGHCAAAWVCFVCMRGCHSSPYYTYMGCVCLYEQVCVETAVRAWCAVEAGRWATR